MRAWILLVAAFLLGGCGGSEASDLDAAADSTLAETARFEVTHEMPAVEGFIDEPLMLRFSGVADSARESAVIRVSDERAALAEGEFSTCLPLEVRHLGDTTYERCGVRGKSHWVERSAERSVPLGPFDVLVPSPGATTSPQEAVALVLRSKEEVRVLGEELVRGTATTRFGAKIDPERLIEELPRDHRPMGADREAWRDGLRPFEIWVDDQNRVRRMAFEQEEIESGAIAKATVEFFEFGVDADVRPPRADEIISQEELDDLIGGLR